MRNRRKIIWFALLLAFSISFAGCSADKTQDNVADSTQTEVDSTRTKADSTRTKADSSQTKADRTQTKAVTVTTAAPAEKPSDKRVIDEITQQLNNPAQTGFDSSTVPEYAGKAYVEINNNVPYFKDAELVATSFESYAQLDAKGRCGICVAGVGTDIMPTQKRGSIGNIKPSGWKQAKYAGLVDGNYLYNRCHLIGYQLTGENDNKRNLITGTRYLNTQGMLPFENMVADYVKETGNHVLYRVTPVFEGDNLLAKGVLMEAKSVEDDGAGILYCVFCYNVQPGVSINYADGSSSLAH